MKNIIKQFIMITAGILTVFSCNYDDNEYDKLTEHAPDPSATYYVQFKDAQKDLEVEIDPANGETVAEIETTIVVAILGLPLDQDLSVNLAVNSSSTATSNMYVLGSSSVVIPAGTVSGSTTLTSVSANMPVDETVTLMLDVDAGANNATAGTTLTYNMLRPAPCKPIPGTYTIDMVDAYGDGWQSETSNGGAGLQVDVDGVIYEFGLCTPYEANSYDCIDDSSAGTATLDIPEGSLSALWSIPGDYWGEIGFTITAPDGSSFKVNPGDISRGVPYVVPPVFCLD